MYTSWLFQELALQPSSVHKTVDILHKTVDILG